ncbi:MAG: hypothetical protein D6705_04155, partial [Deltaproteobacteria bacterium]
MALVVPTDRGWNAEIGAGRGSTVIPALRRPRKEYAMSVLRKSPSGFGLAAAFAATLGLPDRAAAGPEERPATWDMSIEELRSIG